MKDQLRGTPNLVSVIDDTQLPLDSILLGSCEKHLAKLPDSSIDALVFDPPYGLGNKEPSGVDIGLYLAGKGGLNQGGDFMGKNWEIPSVPIWQELLRVLKPGGYCAAFGGTRTWDLIQAGALAGGFELVGRHSLKAWQFSSGFPKSLNIGKALAAAGQDTLAESWQGYGTALKPAWETILLFSKGEPSFQLDMPDFFYCGKASRREYTVNGAIENDHVSKKPLKVMRWLIGHLSRPGNVVLDPYVGSGSTACAAYLEGRHYVGIERDQHYHEIATARLQATRDQTEPAPPSMTDFLASLE